MKTLMISIDNSILDTKSTSAKRMKFYGSICDQLHIIVVGGKSSRINVEINDNVIVYPTNSKNKLLAIFDAINIGNEIIAEGGKWIITSQDPFETGLISFWLSKKYKVKFEVQLHGDFYGNNYWKKERLINWFRFYLGKFIIKRANAVRSVSNRVKKSIDILNKNIYIAHIYSDLPKSIKEAKKGYGLNLLSIGNLVPVKNHGLLIDVFKSLKKQFKDLTLTIVGDGLLKTKLETESVIFVGAQKDLSGYYENADIFIIPSKYEGWGRVVVEAASYGLPIIMTDVGLAGEVIKDKESGIIIPVNDREALYNAISMLAKDETLRKELGQGAKKAVSELPTKKETLEIIKRHWLELVV